MTVSFKTYIWNFLKSYLKFFVNICKLFKANSDNFVKMLPRTTWTVHAHEGNQFHILYMI